MAQVGGYYRSRELEVLHERTHDHPDLLHRQTAPDAVQRTRGERHERGVVVHELEVCGRRGARIRGDGQLHLVEREVSGRDEPPLGPEGFRKGEVARVPMEREYRCIDGRPRGDKAA